MAGLERLICQRQRTERQPAAWASSSSPWRTGGALSLLARNSTSDCSDRRDIGRCWAGASDCGRQNRPAIKAILSQATQRQSPGDAGKQVTTALIPAGPAAFEVTNHQSSRPKCRMSAFCNSSPEPDRPLTAPKASAGKHFPACPRRLRSTADPGWEADCLLLGCGSGK